jgi:hypothetical protein
MNFKTPDQEDRFPPVPEVLLKELEFRIPEKCPELSFTDREVWFYAGQRALVRLLREKFREQNETILTKEN